MRRGAIGAALALVVLFGSGRDIRAGEIYLWTDEQGVVHMTDQWDNVPTPMRSQVTVRESPIRPDPVPPPSSPPVVEANPTEPLTPRPQPFEMSPDLPKTPPATVAPPASPDSRALIPHHRPFIHRAKRPELPFPYNVRLDPVDPSFVWVGPNRVPKDSLSYPRIPLDKQAQFRERVRQLEQRRSSPRKALQSQPPGR
jgi:hypothetical protein